MKTQTKQNKIIAIMSAVILLLVALSATLTFAWFTAVDTKESTNEMQFGVLNLNLSEMSFSAKSGEHAITSVIPGCTVNLTGTVNVAKNSEKAFVRIKPTIMVYSKTVDNEEQSDPQEEQSDSRYTLLTTEKANELSVQLLKNFATLLSSEWGLVLGDQNTNDTNDKVISNLTIADNGTKWIYKLGAVAKNTSNDTTIIDFETLCAGNAGLQIPTSYDNYFQDKVVKIKIDVQAIQAEHLVNSSSQAVSDNATTAAVIASATAWSVLDGATPQVNASAATGSNS